MGTRAYSLVEQKKMQWAKERAEMVGLCGIWGRIGNRRFEEHKPSIRTHYVSSYDIRRAEFRNEDSDTSEKFGRQRSPSLPPIAYKQNYQEENSCGEEGETSGYASDSGERQDYQPSWTNKPRSRKQSSAWNSPNCVNTPDSLNSGESGRPRWGDKGVGVGHLWDASLHNPEARLPAVTDRPGATPPAWLCRATNNTVSEVLVITHPEVTSPVTEYGSCDTVSNSDRTTYLRGQNVTIEPEELLERERKRQKAKELQDAIRQQLDERERKRKEEKERRQKEERLEEERLKKQQETEQKRLEEEHRRQREKEVKEERKEKAMKEAIEKAEQLAREEKIKTRKKHKLKLSESPVPVYEEKTDMTCILGSELKIARVEIEQPKPLDQTVKVKFLEEEEVTDDSKPIIDERPPKKPTEEQIIPLRSDIMQPVEVVKPVSIEAKKDTSTESSDDPDVEPDSLDEELNPEIALLLSTPQEVEVNQLSLIVSPGRLLTPSKFRTNPSYEKATQTNLSKTESKLPMRCRPQQRLEERPKWGVNRPETQYIKQSERDPYYQTRVRRNMLRVRSKPNKPEREDSRSPSPVNMKVQGIQAPVTTVSRGTITPRVMQMVLPAQNSVRASRPRYLSFKGGVGTVVASNVLRQKPEQRSTQPPAEIALVKDVLNQLTSLRQGLTMKQQEWDISRSQTPFSDVSTLSTSA